MTNETGQQLQEAGPSTPVRVSGWKEDIPTPGEVLLEVPSVDRAQRAVKFRAEKEMAEKAEKDWEAIEEKRKEEREKYLENRQKLLNKVSLLIFLRFLIIKVKKDEVVINPFGNNVR
ncbi:hypothetical protein COOONC_19170 [Cooperia oncophora]